MEYKLCYIDGHKAYFTSDFEHQWGDDWNDAPYEHNAGEPYDNWSELTEDGKNFTERKYEEHPIDIKTLYFETNDWTEHTPCSDFVNSPYSVENINRGIIAWLWTDNFKIMAGTTMDDFIETIQQNGGVIYMKMKNKWEK